MKNNLPKVGKYKHYKGNEYEVIGIAKHSESGEELVVYRALYGDQRIWVRPRKMFLEKVKVDGKIIPRFKFQKTVLKNEKHLAASAIIITKETPERVLLLHHKKLDVWIQPGGHVEKFENPLEAVIREIKEETGINLNFLFEKTKKLDHSIMLPVPDFFIEEEIPAHGDVQPHFHLDVLYVVKINFQKVKQNHLESRDIDWFTLDEALKLPLFENTKLVLKKAYNDIHG